MKYKKEDRRVVRTKKDLTTEFLNLLNEKEDIKKVSVVDITEKANYNRATFYVHYSDKQALIDEIIDETIDGFLNALRQPYKQIDRLDLSELSIQSVNLFNYVEDHSDIFRLLFTNNAFSGFKEKLGNCLADLYSNELVFTGKSSIEINKDLLIRYHSFSMIGLLSYWIDHDFIYSSDYMTEQLLKIANYDSTIIKITKQ